MKTHHASPVWWRGEDLNLRRLSRQIYSLIPLTTREPLRKMQADYCLQDSAWCQLNIMIHFFRDTRFRTVDANSAIRTSKCRPVATHNRHRRFHHPAFCTVAGIRSASLAGYRKRRLLMDLDTDREITIYNYQSVRCRCTVLMKRRTVQACGVRACAPAVMVCISG